MVLFFEDYDMERLKERIAIAIAWALPKRIAYWCAMRVGANATQGQYSSQEVPALSFMDAVRRWDMQ